MSGIMLEALKRLDEEFLVEDYEHWAKKNYPNLFGELLGKDPKEISKTLVSLAKLDPTTKEGASDKAILTSQQGPYMQWLIRAFKNSSYDDFMRLSHEYKDQLEIFDDLKKRDRLPADKRDVMKYRTLDDLMQMMQELGAGKDISHHSDFKQDIANIREGLHKICELPDSDIPKNIQKVEDVMTLVCENGKWEVWKAKNEFATMLFDAWGAGAGWCVGGGSERGKAQLDRARNYFPDYNDGGRAHYVCFQQTNPSVSRPENKYLITLGEGGSRPNVYAGYQFNNSLNKTQGIGGNTSDEGQMQAFADFLEREGLTEAFKNSEYGGCACFLNPENDRRLASGEPYRYVGGEIPNKYTRVINKIIFVDSDGKTRQVDAKAHPEFLNCSSINDMTNMDNLINGEPYRYVGGEIPNKYTRVINKIIFVDSDGKTRQVDAKAHPEFLNCSSINDMTNMDNLINGEPYVYDGSIRRVPAKFRKLVKEVVIPEKYDAAVGGGVGIPQFAFLGCTNMTKCTFHNNIEYLGIGCFRVNGFSAAYSDIQVWTEKHHLELANNDDYVWLTGQTQEGEIIGPRHLFYIGVDSPAEADRLIAEWQAKRPQTKEEGSADE